MDEVGLFPLAMVLLPTEQVPLHIFEPRYRELIGECLEQSTPFGLVYADDDGMRDVGTLATVTEVSEQLEDGRFTIVVEGGERFRVVELTEGRSFHTGAVELLEDQHDPPDDEDADRALELFGRLVTLTGADVEAPAADSPQLSYAVAGRFDFSPELKQELLEATSERVRLRRLCELLAAAADTVERQREIAERAQSNGKVHPPRT